MVVNVFLFDDFEVMDAFGPVQVFGCTPEHFYIRFISMRGGLINGKQGMKVWTEPLNPLEIEDIFLIPGGKGVKITVGINYVDGENWIADGKYYSSSTTMAAIDMTLGLLGDMLDIDIAEKAAEEIGYSWEGNF